MKIVMVSHYFEDHRGGMEIVAGQLARSFTGLGHQVTWIACDADAPPDDPAVCSRSVSLPAVNWLERRTGVPYPVPMPAAFRLISDALRDADLVVAHDAYFLPPLLVQFVAHRRRVPVVLVQHLGFVPYRNPLLRIGVGALDRLVVRPALTAAHEVVFISDVTRRYFSEIRFCAPPRLLFNGVDTQVYFPAQGEAERSAERRVLALDPWRPTILFVGRFVEKKGLDYVRRMALRRPEWDWVLAGWGGIDPRAWDLPNVRVFADRRGATLAQIYRAADALVLPSVGEGYPLVVQEALACGLPVVCGEETAAADPAAGGVLTGVPILPRDRNGTVEALLSGLASAIERDSLDATSRELRAAFARRRYSWTSLATTLLSGFAAGSNDVMRSQTEGLSEPHRRGGRANFVSVAREPPIVGAIACSTSRE